MKKLDNFSHSFDVLKNADFSLATDDDIYRTGVIGQLTLTFELAWKALQAVVREHGVDDAATGSPREILQLGCAVGFLDDPDVWLLMLKKRTMAAHIYDEAAIDEMIILIRDSFIPPFAALEATLREKLGETAQDGVADAEDSRTPYHEEAEETKRPKGRQEANTK